MSHPCTPSRRRRLLPILLTVCALPGCYSGRGAGGQNGGPDAGSGDGGSDDAGGGDSGGIGGCASDGASISPLRRLSERQYRNTLRDVFAPAGIDVETEVADELTRIPPDDGELSFRIVDARVSEMHARAWYRLASALSQTVTSDPAKLAAVAGDCATVAAPTAACIDAFLDDFGLRAFRRPLDATERAHYQDIAAGAPDGVEAMRSIIFSLLLAPPFLYHVEVAGEGDDANFELDGYALASRLSFHFWQSTPDAELLAAAADGSILTDEGYAAQLDRVFEDSRTQITVERFYDEWLQLGWMTQFPDTPAFATFAEGTTIGDPDADHIAAAQAEIHALVRHYTFANDGTLADVLLTDRVFTTSPHLAALYGSEVWDGTSDPPAMPAGQRAGIVTRVGFLLTGDQESHPMHRGASIRRRLMCEELPTPDPAQLPPGALDQPPVTEDQTTRQRYEAKTADAVCAGCHSTINPPGFVLEQYDAIGRFRTEELVIDSLSGEVLATLPIDSSATPRLDGSDTVVSTATDLSQQIVDSGKLEGCFAKQYFRATFGRNEDESDACVIGQIETTLVDGGSVRDALREIAAAPLFRSRRVM